MGELNNKNDKLISEQDAINALIEWYGCKPNDIEAFEKIIEALPSAQPEPQWIPVRERLPDKNRACLITNIYGDVAWNYWIDGEWIVLPDYVVAWMPLPKPFKEGKK